jgi:23S rRNA pseudouridine955/2504/2580 synthase
MKKVFLVTNDFVNIRLDKWFKRNVCEVPQSLIEKNIRKGKIRVNDKKKNGAYRLQEKDEIFVNNINFSTDKNTKNKNKYIATAKDISRSSSIFVENNENFAVINKPASIAVQSGTRSKRNILDILRMTKEFENFTPYPVHRIDKETTGLLIVAKNRKYAQLFTSLFRLRKIHKTYLGIVVGEFSNSNGILSDYLFHYEGNKKIKTKGITHFRVIDSNTNYSFLKLEPKTGRKHQLRKQLLMHGHPIYGDSKYRLTESYKNKKNKLMLHAYKINFLINEKKYNFSTEPPSYFKEILKEKYLKSFL